MKEAINNKKYNKIKVNKLLIKTLLDYGAI